MIGFCIVFSNFVVLILKMSFMFDLRLYSAGWRVPAMCFLFLSVLLLSCSSDKAAGRDFGVKSHEATERKIEGSWKGSFSDTEDGMTVRGTEDVTYSLPSHELVSTLVYYLEGVRMCEVKLCGVWSADEEYLVEEYDLDAAEIEVGSAFSDEISVNELRDELLSPDMSSGKCKIISLGDDEMTLLDDEGTELAYRRVQ